MRKTAAMLTAIIVCATFSGCSRSDPTAKPEIEGSTQIGGESSDTAQTATVNAYDSLIGWGMGKERDADNRPIDAVNANKKYADLNAVFVNETDEKKLYLTFDEGYENGYTAEILDILKNADTKATFFVTYDYCKNEPELVQRMIDEGHIVGNHSYTHSSFPMCSEREVRDEIMLLHQYVEERFNYEMKFIRFPKGEFSEKSLKIAQECGYTTVFWSFAHVDWDTNNQPTAKDAFDTITSQTHKGAIYLLHAVSKANTDCLADVLDYWKNNGFAVEKLTELQK